MNRPERQSLRALAALAVSSAGLVAMLIVGPPDAESSPVWSCTRDGSADR